MSLLEDVFLQDEAGEAQELERIIEGDEYEERARDGSDSNENSEKEDEAEEDKRRVDPSSTKNKRVVTNPRFVLNPARLTGPRGISIIPEHFKDFKFKGKGHEKEDLDVVLKKLEHWAYRLYPKFKFEDCLKKIETLGKKRVVVVHLTKIRSDQLISEDTVVQKDSSDEEELAAPLPEEDEFDQLLQQQIELARATPGPSEIRPGFNTPLVDKRSPLMMPKATSSPSISDEQKERMIRNRKLAEERRLARLKAASLAENGNTAPTIDLTSGYIDRNESNNEANDITYGQDETRAKKNRSNVIDSSDEDGELTINQAVSADVHKTNDDMIDLTEVQSTKSIVGNDRELVMTGVLNRKKNVINSDDDDDEEINGDITIETHESTKQKTIDLTEIPRPKSITSNDVKLIVTGVPNKKKNIINSDEDDEEMNETGSMETHESSTQKVIDLTKVQLPKNITSHDVELIITGVPNQKKYIINRDEDDEEIYETDTIETRTQNVIDLTKVQIPKNITSNDVELVITGVPNRKMNIIKSDNNEEINEAALHNSTYQKVIDLTEGYQNPNKVNVEITATKNRNTNVLDSSESDDEENDVSVISEAVVVDIHQNKTSDVKKAGNETVEDNNDENSDEIQNKSTESANTKDSTDNVTNFDDTNKDTEPNERNETEIDKKVQNNDKFVTPAAVDENAIVTDDDADKTEKIDKTDLNTGKENIDNTSKVDVLDDLMDVDFSEDF